MEYVYKIKNRRLINYYKHTRQRESRGVYIDIERLVLRDMPTEVYCTRANTLPVKEVWMVTDVYGKIKGMKID